MMNSDIVWAWACRILLAATFGASAVHKLQHPLSSRRSLVAYGAPFRGAAQSALFFGLTATEFALALFWLAFSPRLASPATILVLATFSVAMLRMHGDRSIDCGCGGLFNSVPVGIAPIARNIALSFVALLPLLLPTHSGLLGVGIPWPQIETLPYLAALTSGIFMLCMMLQEGLHLVEERRAVQGRWALSTLQSAK